jgi:general L-amino acid transport system permease protein
MTDIPSFPAPTWRSRPLPGWLRGLFGSPANAVITIGLVLIAAFIVLPLLRWAFIDATWAGTPADCAQNRGACWAFLGEKLSFILFAFYPPGVRWQAAAATILILALIVITAMPRFWHPRLVAVWGVSIAFAVGLMSGTLTGNAVPTQKWGGFPLTVLLSVTAMLAAFPLGVLLAFGRRSQMGLIRALCVAFIEIMRGVPLIAVLYVSTLLFPLMLPAGADIDKLLRAQVAITLFVAAYMAEIVRAGLQSVPRAQGDAAVALGFTWWASMRLIILPQALRSVIPSFVNLGIGLFLDTTLVIVIGLFDFLNAARVSATDPQWLGFYNEAFAFAALVYFVFCAAGSRYSTWLEARLRSAKARF